MKIKNKKEKNMIENFLTVIITRDGTVYHSDDQSVERAVYKACLSSRASKGVHYWVWKWDGKGTFDVRKHLRDYRSNTPKAVVDAALQLGIRLPLALKNGRFLDSDFKDMPSVKAQSKAWKGWVFWEDGQIEWYENGVMGRQGGPSMIRPDGTIEWWENGEFGRKVGPCMITPEGTIKWERPVW
jgi:hypothetical protein